MLDHNRCILCTRCVRTCAEIEGAHVWEMVARGIHARIVSDLNQKWGQATTCTDCGKCVQACPTGALAAKGKAVEEMVRSTAHITALARQQRSPHMKKLKLATVWLDGCSGCHMSLLDLDGALIPIVRKVDIVYGPLVDAQEFPEDVDVTLVEGAISTPGRRGAAAKDQGAQQDGGLARRLRRDRQCGRPAQRDSGEQAVAADLRRGR